MKKLDMRDFQPETLARLDAEMWRAYYQHHFFRLFRLLIQLCYHFAGLRFIVVLHGAYHLARAAITFRKTKGHENSGVILYHLQKFFKHTSMYHIYAFDYNRAAELELRWWMIDRYPQRYKQTRAEVLAESVAILFNIPLKDALVYGTKREQAMLLIGDHHHDRNAAVDWDKLRRLLVDAYQSLYAATRKPQSGLVS